MKLIVMCHRPRTQRIGPDSEPQEIVAFKGSEKKARQVIADIRKAHKEMLKAGWPWPGGEAHGFQSQPNDSFYLQVVER